MKRFALALSLALSACEEAPPPAAPPAQPIARRAVAAEAVAALERELAEPAATAASDEPELAEHVDGLLATLAGADEAMKEIAREELASLGAPAVQKLAAALERTDLAPASRSAAAEALAHADDVVAARALVSRVMLARKQKDPDAWMRAQCAWRLSQTTQDWCVPSLILALRYETDYETVMWLARTLAHFGNFAGLDGLRVIAESGTASAERAAGSLNDLASELGFANAHELERAWSEGDERLPSRDWSKRRELETWRLIASFAQWQLRGVDDARFVLSREGARCAELLASALADENRYVRTHAAQCLERMGRRARGAGPALIAALDDPELAIQATLTLGATKFAGADAPLLARAAKTHPLEQRVAAARALGVLGRAENSAAVRALTDAQEPYELRIAATCALAALTPLELTRADIELLTDALASGRIDPLGPESALHAWLSALTAAFTSANHIALIDGKRVPDSPTLATLDAWNALAPTDPRERTAARAQIVKTHLADLLPR